MKRKFTLMALPLAATMAIAGCEQVVVNRLDQPDVLLRGTKIVPVVPLTAREKQTLRAAQAEAEARAAAEAAANEAAQIPATASDGVATSDTPL